MRTDELLDSYTVEGLEVEMSVIQSIYRGIKALIQCRDKHAARRDFAEKRAKTALDNGDNDLQERWMNIFWKEDSAVQQLDNTLDRLGEKDK